MITLLNAQPPVRLYHSTGLLITSITPHEDGVWCDTENGFPVFFEQPDSIPVVEVCPDCGGLGMVLEPNPAYNPLTATTFTRRHQWAVCPSPTCEAGNAERQRIWELQLARAGVPERYAQFTFATWQEAVGDATGKERAVIAARLFAHDLQLTRHDLLDACGLTVEGPDKLARWLVLFGPVGTGKTGLMVSIANALLERGHGGMYVKVGALFERGLEETDWERYHRAPLLFVDDCNIQMKESYTWFRQQMENLFRARYEAALPMVVTLNLGPDEFEQQWGVRATTVMRDMGQWVKVGGVSLRAMDSPL